MTAAMEVNNCTNTTSISTSIEEYLQHLQDRATITMIPTFVCLSLFSVAGLLGNSLILYVYSRKIKVNATKILLMTIASFDLVANIGAIPSEMSTMFQYWNFGNPTLCKCKVFLNVFSTVGGGVTLLAVAVVRYRKVCKPHGWQITNRHSKYVIGLAALCGCFFSFPYVVLYGRRSKPTPCYKIHGYECYTDDSYRDTLWPLVNNGLFVLLYFLCVVPLIVLYILIGTTAWKHSLVKGSKKRDAVVRNIDVSSTVESSINRELIPPYSCDETHSVLNVKTECLLNDEESADKCARCVSGTESSKATINQPLIINTKKRGDTEINEDNDGEPETPAGSEKGIHVLLTNIQKMNSSSVPVNKKLDGIKTDDVISPENTQRESSVDEICASLSGAKREVQFKLEDSYNHDNNANFPKPEPELAVDEPSCVHHVTFKRNHNEVKPTRRRSLGRMTVMLIAISVIYAVGYLSFLLMTLYKNLFPQSYANLNMAELSVYHLFLRMFFLNCAANSIIYGFCDAKFRQECVNLFSFRNKRQM